VHVGNETVVVLDRAVQLLNKPGTEDIQFTLAIQNSFITNKEFSWQFRANKFCGALEGEANDLNGRPLSTNTVCVFQAFRAHSVSHRDAVEWDRNLSKFDVFQHGDLSEAHSDADSK